MSLSRFREDNTSRFLAGVVAAFMLTVGLALPAAAAKAKQKTFATPEEATSALVAAVKSDNDRELASLFGPGSRILLFSGDKVADRADRQRFTKACDARNAVEYTGPDTVVLHIGDQDYSFPIPLVRKGDRWSFDTKAGREEILNRRIGRNERSVIEVLHNYADAQREYAAMDRDADGILEFAQRLISTKGKKNGLYWEVKEGEKESPFGPLMAKAEQEGYAGKLKADRAEPFHGYYFRVLKAQGKHATGGAFEYVVKGQMILGFALVAYPARYGSSGVMTFIVNQEGVVYEKDLGRETQGKASAMKKYDPDQSWKKIEEVVK